MKILANKKLSNGNEMTIEIDDRDEKVALGKAITLLQKDVCDCCGATDIDYFCNKATDDKGGTFLYIKRKCLNKECNATSTLGEYQGGLGYFWKKFEVYNPNQQPNHHQ